MQFLEILWKMLENIEILNLSQQEEEETIYETVYETIYKKLFNYLHLVLHRKFISNRNDENRDTYGQTYPFRTLILKLSKMLMYEFWYDYVKRKYNEKAKFCFMDTDSFIQYKKTDDIYKYIAEDVETIFEASIYELQCNSIDRPLPKGKKKKVIRLMKDKLGGKIMKKFFGLRAKIHSYLIDDGSEDKKAKGMR